MLLVPTKIKGFINRVQNLIEQKVQEVAHDEGALQQSRFWVRTVTWSLIGTTAFSIGWLMLAKTEEIVIANGKLEPMGDVKDIQIPVGGVALDILVKSGDHVKKNDVLIQLDTVTALQKVNSLRDSQKEKLSQLEKKRKQFELKKEERIRTLDLGKQQISTTRAILELEQRILQRFNSLNEQGAISDVQLMKQQNKVQVLVGKIVKEEIELNRKNLIINQQIEEIEASMAGYRGEKAELQARLTEAEVTLKYKSLRSPVDGVVFDLKPTTTGFVAQSSEPVLKIVPFDQLEADVEIPSNKIGFVRLGMQTDISIDSFPSTDFGVIKGKLIVIGSDALPPDQSQQRLEYLYPATIELESQQLRLKDGTSLPLQVGMSLTANIKLRKVSYMQLLLSNFQSKAKSLREL